MRLILFDIDGTLIDTGGAGGWAMRLAVESEFERLPSSEGVAFAGRTDRAITSELFRLHAIEDTRDNWERFQNRFLQHLAPCLQQRSGRVLGGVVPLLDYLAERSDTQIGLLTGNLRHAARVKLEHFGLHEYFMVDDKPAIGGFGDAHHDRDDVAREALASAQRHVGDRVAWESVWVIGDTPLDIQCARAIGARILAVATGVHSAEQLSIGEPDALLSDLTQAASILDRR